jgi:hypothetical protein
MRLDSPNETLPSDNELGIPSLRLDGQASIVHPVTPWGSIARGAGMPGTWVFYVDDYRFRALASNPLQLVTTGCKGTAELNLSLFPSSPIAWAIWATWQKRAAARTWQDAGMPILVDLCVPTRFAALNLTGVPSGWQAYATRGFAGRESDLEAECALAAKHGGPGATVAVYGGGKRIREACAGIPQAVYIEQFAEARHGQR